MKDKFKDLRIVDNFYQTSAFFPMPLTLIGTLDENGKTSYGAYSLIFLQECQALIVHGTYSIRNRISKKKNKINN